MIEDSDLMSVELKKDLEREHSVKRSVVCHKGNIESHEQYRGKEIVIVVNDSPLFTKLKDGLYFDSENRQPSYFTGKTVDRIIDILNEPDRVSLIRYSEELEELKKKYNVS